MTDPIADLLTRIRNSQMVKKSEVVLPYSKIKFNICKILEKQGWVGKVEQIELQNIKKSKAKTKKEKDSRFKQIRIELLYQNGKSKISSLKRISKPGRRIYASKDELPVVLNNYGIAIISTSMRLMTNKEAKKLGLGGEVICEIF